MAHGRIQGPNQAAKSVPTTANQDIDATETLDQGLQLLVLEADGLSVYEVPRGGSLVIGRADDCDVKLRDPLASRHHAVLHSSPLTIEDRRSANGTRVGSVTLPKGEPTQVELGQTMSIGTSILIVRHADPERESSRARDTGPVTRRPSSPPLLVSRDPGMTQLSAHADRVARGSINVLVLGETGVGKGVLAERIHRASPRREEPFVRIDCSLLTEALLERELFGYERGAFVGAITARPGRLETADGGSIFLDEVGELPLSLQAKLLQVIEAGEVTRVGALRPRKLDVRFIAATHHDLEGLVASGAFRSNLYFRLNGVSLQVPPLRQRAIDIIALAEMFLASMTDQLDLPARPTLSSDAIARLNEHAWPGNIRELRNAIERAVMLCTNGKIEAHDLSLSAPLTAATKSGAEPLASDAPLSEPRLRIIDALEKCHGNQTRAAKLLGMPRRTLVAKLSLYKIPRPRKSAS